MAQQKKKTKTTTKRGNGSGAGRTSKLNAATRARFLKTLLGTNNVTKACQAAGVSAPAIYKLRKNDPGFAAAWDDVKDQIVHRLEDLAHARATEGWEEPVWHKGEIVGYETKFDNRLLTFLLQAYKPDLYRKRHELTGPNGKDSIGDLASALGAALEE